MTVEECSFKGKKSKEWKALKKVLKFGRALVYNGNESTSVQGRCSRDVFCIPSTNVSIKAASYWIFCGTARTFSLFRTEVRFAKKEVFYACRRMKLGGAQEAEDSRTAANIQEDAKDLDLWLKSEFSTRIIH